MTRRITAMCDTVPWRLIGGLWTSAVSWLDKAFWAILDQGCIATSNFVISLLLARQLVSAQYGAYAVAFEVLLLMSVLYASFILEPMSVFGSSVYRSNLPEYLGALCRIQFWLALAFMGILGGAAWVVHAIAGSDSLAKALAGVAVAGPFVSLFWIVRRAFYVTLSPCSAAVGALVYAITVLSSLGLLYWRQMLSPFLAFLLMSVGALVAVALLLRRITVRFPSSQVLSFSELLHRHWNYGRWALGSSIATWLAGATYYFALSGFHGLPAAGELRALLNLSSPVGQGFAALSLLSLPYASRRYHEAGLAALKRLRFYLLALYAGGAATYFVIILGVRVPLLHFMYRDKYSGIVSLIPWLGLGMVLRIASTAQATLLRALQSPSQVFLAYGTAGAIALLIGLPLTWWEGLRGAVISGVLSSASAFVLTSVLVQRSFRAAVGVKSSICFQATA